MGGGQHYRNHPWLSFYLFFFAFVELTICDMAISTRWSSTKSPYPISQTAYALTWHIFFLYISCCLADRGQYCFNKQKKKDKGQGTNGLFQCVRGPLYSNRGKVSLLYIHSWTYHSLLTFTKSQIIIIIINNYLVA